MEMNTRLQVEHPVTEMVTGVDLVEWQVRVAAGERLGFGQDDVALSGHAVEARICAEDPARGFLPSGGTVLKLCEPQGDGVRTDSGLSEGTEVGSLYDPMLSKVIAYGPDRATALRKLRAALGETVTLGVQTNAGFLRRLLAHPAVVAGELDTGLVEREVDGLVSAEVPGEVYVAAGLLRQARLFPSPAPSRNWGLRPQTPDRPERPRPQTPDGLIGAGPGSHLSHGLRGAGLGSEAGDSWVDPFSVPNGWRLGGTPAWTVHHLRVPGHEPVTIRVRSTAEGVEFLLDGAAEPLRGSGGLPPVSGRGGTGEKESSTVTLHLEGRTHTFTHYGTWLGRDADAWNVQDHDPVTASLTGAARTGVDSLTAPMPGTVTVVKVAVGDEVAAGQSLLVVEAMKMEHVISAPHAGTVAELDVTPGSTVAMDQVLAVIAPQEQELGQEQEEATS
jgi:acetyl-CoA/propionyl-CoA carboxylase biotin carboxyl carrier protein